MFQWLCASENQPLNDWFKKSREQNESWLTHTRFPAFASATGILSLSYDWFIGLFMSFAIGQSDYVGFSLTTLK